jgi:hypothetical protein
MKIDTKLFGMKATDVGCSNTCSGEVARKQLEVTKTDRRRETGSAGLMFFAGLLSV